VAVNPQADAEFTDFVRGNWAKLVRLGYGLTGDRGLGEDLAQSALAKAYASWPRVCRAGNPEAYVRKILVNASRDRLRRRRVDELLTDSMPEPVGSGPDDSAEIRTALMKALLRLPAGQREIVVLRFWLDLTETEAASAVGCSVGNVKSQASRALAKLRSNVDLKDEVTK
jgi:RNA polymerase sigma-70 factor (sigma-E family)